MYNYKRSKDNPRPVQDLIDVVKNLPTQYTPPLKSEVSALTHRPVIRRKSVKISGRRIG